MILIDPRTGSGELLPHIQKLGVKCEKSPLEYGDAAMSGNGPKGAVAIGVERKKLHDILHCIDDGRYAAHQLPGMMQLYDRCYLIIEGVWSVGAPPFQEGVLIESNTGGCTWGPCRYRTQRVMYSKLYRYLMSISLAGVIITYSRDIHQTAVDICEIFHYYQKRWDDHTALRQTQKFALPTLNGKPTLTRKWAADITDIGVKLSEEAERLFKTPIRLATASEMDWLKIKGIGVPTAQQIVSEVNGWKK